MIKEKISSAAVNLAYTYLDVNPERHMIKLLHMVDKLDRKNILKSQLGAFRTAIMNRDSNWHRLLLSMWEDIDPGVRKALFKNLIFNGTVLGGRKHDKLAEKYGCNIPWAILMDPTSACNLKCTGCWAAEYGKQKFMKLKTLDSIIKQGKKMGVHVYAYSGGEPLLRKKDIIKLCEKHKDCIFTAFTNGTLIDEEFADEMLRVKNFIPGISIEGFDIETNSRRGAGTYESVTRAMELLKQRKLAFGASCCYTRQNTEVVGSEAFIDDLIARGVKFAWFFTYIPVGASAVPDLMVTAEQREFMYRQLRNFRETKPLFTIDFWNDGEYVGGCVAGGRRYLHINAAGDIEPCAFIHYSDSNIHQKTLLEALQTPLFLQYRANQPFNSNHLRPCPLLDNPDRLVQMVEASGAKSTDYIQPEDVNELKSKCADTAEKWAQTAGRIWEESRPCSKCSACDECRDT
jgi:MoaA/NifB/PqqE/SkfB family radical SAM enzyme